MLFFNSRILFMLYQKQFIFTKCLVLISRYTRIKIFQLCSKQVLKSFRIPTSLKSLKKLCRADLRVLSAEREGPGIPLLFLALSFISNSIFERCCWHSIIFVYLPSKLPQPKIAAWLRKTKQNNYCNIGTPSFIYC